MDEIQLNDWQEFECKIKDLRKKFHKPGQLVFRGVADSTWPLKTTLERCQSVEMYFADYYRVITVAQPHIQSFTTKTTWDEIEPYQEIASMADAEYDKLDLYLGSGRLRAYGYMAYLRHHGFPSPLMDWTRSPYIAAFFAFNVPPKDPPPERIAIFAYCERPTGGKSFSSDNPRILRLGPNVRTHRRHHIQQGEYTICLQWEHNRPWRFVPHERVFSHTSSTQDRLWKLTIPWTERIKVMELLDDHNVNAASLIESDAALLETLAFRQFSRNFH